MAAIKHKKSKRKWRQDIGKNANAKSRFHDRKNKPQVGRGKGMAIMLGRLASLHSKMRSKTED
jgi:hypothetical protein